MRALARPGVLPWLVLLVPLATLGLPLVGLLDLALAPSGPTAAAGTQAVLRATAWSLGYGVALGTAATIAALPMARVVPVPLLLGAALVHPLARGLGVLGWGLAPGPTPTAIALTSGALPLAALVLRLRLRARPVAWLDAAADLGASPGMRRWWIDLPHLRPALAVAIAWVTMQALGDVSVSPLAGGGKVYGPGLLARDALLRDGAPGRAAVVVLVMIAIAIALAWRLGRDLRTAAGIAEGRRATPEASTTTTTAEPARAWLGWSLWLAGLAPLLGLLDGALGPVEPGAGTRLLERLGATLGLAVVVGAVATAIGFALVLALRTRASAGSLAAIILPVALPSSVVGMLWLAAAQRVGVGPSDGLTVVAMLAPAVAASFLVGLLLLRGVPAALALAAADLGAGPLPRLAWLWWPLAWRPLLVAGLVAMAWVLCEASIPAFTAGPGGTTLTMGLRAVARSGDVATLHRWCLGLAAVPLVAGLGWHAAARWTRPRRRGPR